MQREMFCVHGAVVRIRKTTNTNAQTFPRKCRCCCRSTRTLNGSTECVYTALFRSVSTQSGWQLLPDIDPFIRGRQRHTRRATPGAARGEAPCWGTPQGRWARRSWGSIQLLSCGQTPEPLPGYSEAVRKPHYVYSYLSNRFRGRTCC